MKLRNRILTCALACLTALAGIVSATVGAQTADETPAKKEQTNRATFIVYRDERGEVTCRVATAEEARRLTEAEPGDGTHLIYKGAPRMRTPAGIVESYPVGDTSSAGDPGTSSSATAQTTPTLAALQPSAGLHIFLHGTSQLEQPENAEAKNAFIVAANRWEALISNPINVVLDVDFGTTWFGDPYPSANILGQTQSREISTSFSNVRQQLIGNSPTAAELQLYNALPASAVPVEGATTATLSSVIITRPNARALGLTANITDPASVPANSGDAKIGFNSAFQFDFNPDDGITAGKTDFDAVVTHEIGHSLGFISESGGDAPVALSLWDVFRFRPTAGSLGTMATAQRVMAKGGSQVFFDNQTHTVANVPTQELGLSTGGPNPSGTDGDGRQSSHWKDDALVTGRPYIGIMDPTIGSGVRRVITENDTNALDAFGYAIGGTVPPPPPPPPGPATGNFVNAVTLAAAAGSVTGTNLNATLEAGEPAHSFQYGASVWYFWTSPTTGTATFDTVGSDYDTILGAYTGTTVSGLSFLADNDDIVSQTNVQSRVTFPTQAGVTYRIQVGGWDDRMGNIVLNWTSSGTAPTPTPTPVPVSYSVSGRVVDPDGSPLGGVQVSLDGPNLTNGFPAQPTVTAGDGTYSFTLLAGGGNYAVHPTDSRYAFTPATAALNNIGANQTNVNFTAAAPATVTGTVSAAGTGALMSGVTVTVTGFNPTRVLKTAATDATGRWTVTGLTVGQFYSFGFSKLGYSFSPPVYSNVITFTPYDIGNVTATKVNPIDTTEFFVAQQYRDFLGREPDAQGLAFWTQQIEQCGANAACRDAQRINVSGAFFLAIEFQETGYLVERIYKTSFGDRVEASTGLVVPIITRQEFMADTPIISNGIIVGQGNWQAQLEANKQAYLLAFVQRDRFRGAYPTTRTPAQFVADLNTNAGLVLTQAEINSLVAEFGGAPNTSDETVRASVLRKIAENGALDKKEKNRAFVLMQYYGYLRRNPYDAPERDLNFAGWNFWLTKLNENNGDFHAAQMVKAFLDSSEYRDRFANLN